MKTQNRTHRPVKAIINPGRTFTAPVLPEWTIAVADRIVAEFAVPRVPGGPAPRGHRSRRVGGRAALDGVTP